MRSLDGLGAILAGRDRRWWACVLALIVLPLAVYLPLLLPGRAPTDFDAFTYLYPYHHALAQAWSEGRWFPLWNPGIYLGAPLLANIQAAALYPPSLLFLLLPGPAALGWSMVLSLAIAGVGMLAYAWTAGLRPAGSIAAASAYVLSAHLTVHLAQLNQSATMGWTPWLMLAFDRAAARPRRWLVPAIAALSALTVLAGHTQQAYLSFLIAGLAGLLGLRLQLRHRRWRQAGLTLVIWMVGVGLGAGLAAAQLLPTLELQRLSYRHGGLTMTEANVAPLPLRGVLGSLLPHYSGPLQPEYTGICTASVVLFLATLAVAARWRRTPVAFWAAVSALAIWASMGSSGKLFTVLFHAVPGLSLFRVPSRLLLLSTVGIALLAGHGVRTVQQLVTVSRRRGWTARGLRMVGTATIVMALLVAAALAGEANAVLPRPLRWLPEATPPQDVLLLAAASAAALLVVLIALWGGRRTAATAALALALLVAGDSWLATERYHTRLTDPASLYTDPGPVAALVAAGPNTRYLSLVSEPQLSDYPRLLQGRRPDLGMGDGRLSADGYDGGLLPLGAYVRFRAGALPPGSHNPPDVTITNLTQRVWDPSWLQQAGISGVIAGRGSDPNPPGCRCLVPVASAGSVTLWRPVGAQPSRAWVSSRLGRRPARIVADRGEAVTIQVPNGPAGRLVLADTYYPGWSATVDGRAVAIGRAGGMLRAVDVPAGSHQVVFSYQPASFRGGLALSLVSLVLVLLLWLWPGRRPAG